MYNLNANSSIAIIANTKIKSWSLGEYLRIVSFIPNLNYKKLNWYSDKKLHPIIKEIDNISEVKNLKNFNSSKYDHVIDLHQNLPNNPKTFYINNLFSDSSDDKIKIKNLLDLLANTYGLKKYKTYFNKKKILKNVYDLFICWDTDEKWKIKRYPHKQYLILKKMLEKKFSIKIKIQNKNDSIKKYVENIRQSKIILSVMTFGCHVAMLHNKNLIVLVGPNNFDDLKFYKKAKVILPENKCVYRPCNLPNGIDNCGCMPQISLNKIFNEITKIYEKIQK